MPNPDEQTEKDQFANDPFFKRGTDSEWNACIGAQGDEENYLDGYLEAANELASAIIDKKMLEKRDTLVLPILYNARHAIELALKFCVERFATAKLLKREFPRNHNIRAYWEMLDEAKLGDQVLTKSIVSVKPFIESLAAIDADGQELRYHQNSSEDASMANYSLANLEVIRTSLLDLAKIIADLKYRTIAYLRERATGSFTCRCSRSDLLYIVKTMPPLNLWNEPIFDERKAALKADLGLSNKAFSNALDVIKANREMRGMLGEETALRYISDDSITSAIKEWRRLHPPVSNPEQSDVGLDYFDLTRLEEWQGRAAIKSEVVSVLQKLLTDDQLADLEVVYSLGRDGWFSESYDERLDRTRRIHAAKTDRTSSIVYLLEKTNLLTSVARGAQKLGRLSLATSLTVL